MRLRFFGAVRNVTGSQHLLEAGRARILLDCGLFHGRREEANRRNRAFDFPVAKIGTVLLSHSHIDHSGKLPVLMKHGFQGEVFCTHATRDLCTLMLKDAAYIQEKDAEYMNKKRDRNDPPVEPLYTQEHVNKILHNFHAVSYGKTFKIARGITASFLDAGHILGSAAMRIDIAGEGRITRIGFTGDIGPRNLPIIRDPEHMGEVDMLISESTYGNRTHGKPGEVKAALAEHIGTTVRRGGKVIVPAFSVGRTQALMYLLNELFNEGRLPAIPVFVDSPLSINTTEVFRMHPECFDSEMLKVFETKNDPFGFAKLTYVRDAEESKKLNFIQNPCVIVSASGMCESGRILHHLKHNIINPRNMVLLMGYQAENTLGQRLASGAKKARIYGMDYDVRADVVTVDGLSAHADCDGLVNYIMNCTRARTTFLVHGESAQAEALADTLRHAGVTDVRVPVEGEAVEV